MQRLSVILSRRQDWCGFIITQTGTTELLRASLIDLFAGVQAMEETMGGTCRTTSQILGKYLAVHFGRRHIPGINGNVDLNVCYRDYPAEISGNKRAPEAEPPKPAAPTYKHKVGEHVVF